MALDAIKYANMGTKRTIWLRLIDPLEGKPLDRGKMTLPHLTISITTNWNIVYPLKRLSHRCKKYFTFWLRKKMIKKCLPNSNILKYIKIRTRDNANANMKFNVFVVLSMAKGRGL